MFKRQPWKSRHSRNVIAYGPGQALQNPVPGDFILTHGNSWTSKMIRFGQKLKYWGTDAIYTRWNHAAMIVSQNGDIIEALGGGVQKRNIAVYKGTEYHVISLQGVDATDRAHEVEFAEACLNESYGWLTIVSIALSLLFVSKFGFGLDGQEICSALVARCVERTGEIFPQDPWHIMPADLAKYFDVKPSNLDIGTIPDANAAVQQRSK